MEETNDGKTSWERTTWKTEETARIRLGEVLKN
jgi:hypothetical protein